MSGENNKDMYSWLKPIGLLFLQLFSVWFGFQLHSCAIESSEKRENIKVSSALKIEIAQNDKVMKSIWNVLDENQINKKAKEIAGGSLEDRIELVKFEAFLSRIYSKNPQWCKTIWKTRAVTIVNLLEPELFESVFRYYSTLSELDDILMHIKQAKYSDKQKTLWRKSIEIVQESGELKSSINKQL